MQIHRTHQTLPASASTAKYQVVPHSGHSCVINPSRSRRTAAPQHGVSVATRFAPNGRYHVHPRNVMTEHPRPREIGCPSKELNICTCARTDPTRPDPRTGAQDARRSRHGHGDPKRHRPTPRPRTERSQRKRKPTARHQDRYPGYGIARRASTHERRAIPRRVVPVLRLP